MSHLATATYMKPSTFDRCAMSTPASEEEHTCHLFWQYNMHACTHRLRACSGCMRFSTFPEKCILIQKRHPYTGNLNSETSGDSKNTFLHCGDVSVPSVLQHLEWAGPHAPYRPSSCPSRRAIACQCPCPYLPLPWFLSAGDLVAAPMEPRQGTLDQVFTNSTYQSETY